MQDWEYTTNELIHYAEGQNELLHYRTKGALNKKVAQYIRDGGKLINGKIVYAKKAARKASDKLVKGKVTTATQGIGTDNNVKVLMKEFDNAQKTENVALKKRLKSQKTKDKLKYALKSTKYGIEGAIDRGMSRAMLKKVKVKRGHTQKWK